MNFPHSMRPSNDAEFPGSGNATRGVGRSKQRPYEYIHYSNDAEFPGPVGTGRGALGGASLRRKRSGQGNATTYTFDTYPNKSKRG
jgi:hypothetical protein